MQGSENSSKLVLVTGGSGFIASYCMIDLLKAGYHVRASVRSLQKAAEVKDMLRQGGIQSFDHLSFTEADLGNEASWAEAAKGCTYVIHTASPTPNTDAKTDDDFIRPAVNGLLFVMRAARNAGVKRFVLTSAFGAVGYGTKKTTPYTEEDWTVINDTVAPYQKSKTLSEKAAWDFIKKEGQGMELSVINPTGVYGPVLTANFSHSIQPILQMLKGDIKAVPKMSFGCVDVRDLADLHLRAMTMPEANGQRFIAVAGKSVSMLDVATILRKNLGDQASKAPTKTIPTWLVKLAAHFNKRLAFIAPYAGLVQEASNDKAKRLLDWKPRSSEEAIVATAKSLIDLKLV